MAMIRLITTLKVEVRTKKLLKMRPMMAKVLSKKTAILRRTKTWILLKTTKIMLRAHLL
jgi:hypothetical protein